MSNAKRELVSKRKAQKKVNTPSREFTHRLLQAGRPVLPKAL
jgi:hypothetical protein